MSYEHLSTTMPVARRSHQCEVCLEEIPAGHAYRKEVGIYEGTFQSVSVHGQCKRLMNEYAATYAGADSYTFDELREWIADNALLEAPE